MKTLMLALSTILILSLGIFSLASGFQAGQRKKEADAKRDPVRLRDAMVDAAASAYKAYDAEFAAGTLASPDVLYVWSSRWRAAEIRATQSKKEIARAYENHLARMQNLHGRIQALHKAKARGGEESKYEAVKYYVAEAELLLLAESQGTI